MELPNTVIIDVSFQGIMYWSLGLRLVVYSMFDRIGMQ
jgi:hypothetical protein